MKSFVISLLAFALIISAIAASSLYIGNVTRELGDMVKNFAPTDKEGFFKAKDLWEKNERIICVFVSHKDIDNVNLAFGVLEEKINNNDGVKNGRVFISDAPFVSYIGDTDKAYNVAFTELYIGVYNVAQTAEVISASAVCATL